MKSQTAQKDQDTPYISVAEAAEFLRLSEISIRRYLTKKILKRYKVGSRTLLRRDEVLSLVKAQ